MTRLSGQHQIILGYEFLKEFNPQIDWTMGTLRFSDMETVQAIIPKRVADAKHLSAMLSDYEKDHEHLCN